MNLEAIHKFIDSSYLLSHRALPIPLWGQIILLNVKGMRVNNLARVITGH